MPNIDSSAVERLVISAPGVPAPSSGLLGSYTHIPCRTDTPSEMNSLKNK